MKESIIEGFRLSPQQRHVWLLQQSENSPFYQALCSVLIKGNLEIAVLKQALRILVERNEILRTTFQLLPGMVVPVQVVNDDISLPFEEYSFQELDSFKQNAQIEALILRLSAQPVNYAKEPNWRVCLVKISPNRYKLFILAAAICLDASALENLAKELSYCYAAILTGEEFSDNTVQFADLAEWQNQLLESEEAEIGKEYWRDQPVTKLSDFRLPFERRTDNQTFKPEKLLKTLGPEMLARLEKAAGNHQVLLSTFLLACWQVLCWRFTGEPEHICIGTAFDGRQYEELKNALGLLEKYLPLCSRLEPEMRLNEVLKQVDAAKREADNWQECFTWEQAARNIVEEVTYPPLSFSFKEKLAAWETAGISFLIDSQSSCSDRFQLKLSCIVEEDQLVTEFQYDSNLLQRNDVEQMSEHFYTLLESASHAPEIAIARLNLLSEAQRRRLLIELNDTKTDYAEDKCFHELFEEQVKQSPDNIAVVFGDYQLSYAELNARSNQLARELQNIGVGPETRVVLFVERSQEMIIGALGTLKAGGAYVPLDSTYPSERLKTVVDDAGVTVILTQQKLAENLPETKTKIINLDSDWDLIAQHSPENMKSFVRPDNLAYVIYTSGSTGKPKGVMISHGGLVNYLNWCISAYKVGEGSGAPVHSPLTFDLTITSIFSPLLTGRSVILLAEEQGVGALAHELGNGSNFSLVKITPAHLEVLSQQLLEKQILTKIGALIIGGETLLGENLSFWMSHAPQTRLINEYGPTETVVGVCTYEVPSGVTCTGTVPIGRPIINTQMYLLDAELQPVPVGVPGEIYIGGAGLARGYLNRPALTAESFIPNPFSLTPGARLYRTGDLARYLPDGQIDFLGRVDHQVKVRGYRIELGEIEAVLSEYPGVREAVVIVREDRPTEKRLAGYIVFEEAERVSSENAIREYVKRRLPEYMVPTVFVEMKQLPLTPNGKVDRNALSAQKIVEREAGQRYVAAGNAVEEKLVEIWREVLGVERVGINDNFFELGGHSLLATQVISRVRTQFGLEVSLQRIFEFPTIADLGRDIVQQQLPLLDGEETKRLLIELEKLSDDEVRAILAEEHQLGG